MLRLKLKCTGRWAGSEIIISEFIRYMKIGLLREGIPHRTSSHQELVYPSIPDGSWWPYPKTPFEIAQTSHPTNLRALQRAPVLAGCVLMLL